MTEIKEIECKLTHALAEALRQTEGTIEWIRKTKVLESEGLFGSNPPKYPIFPGKKAAYRPKSQEIWNLLLGEEFDIVPDEALLAFDKGLLDFRHSLQELRKSHPALTEEALINMRTHLVPALVKATSLASEDPTTYVYKGQDQHAYRRAINFLEDLNRKIEWEISVPSSTPAHVLKGNLGSSPASNSNGIEVW